MRAIIYARVSSDASGHGKSVSEQEKECRAVAAREGWDVAQVLVDNDIGASRYSAGVRTAYQQLDRTLQPGDVLVTWEASRAQRDLAAYIELRDLCTTRGVLWCYSGRIYDLARGDDRFVTGLDALLAEKEVEQTRDRVMRGMRANREAGRPHGKLPYGYCIVRNPDTGESLGREPHPETAPRVQEIIRRILAGDSIYSICKDFNERGIPTPRPKRDGTAGQWISPTLRTIARNPTYAGHVVHLGKIVGHGTAVWEPIISQEDHELVTAILDDPTRWTRKTRGSEPKWLLTFIATCGHCGATMVRSKNRGHNSYTCCGSTPEVGKKRFCVARVMYRVDRFVEEAVVRRLEGQDLAPDRDDDGSDHAAARKEVQVLRARLDGFMDAAAAGDLTPAALARIEARLLPEIEVAEQRARDLVQSPIVAAVMGADARAKWKALTVRDRREVIRAVVDVVITRIPDKSRNYPDGTGIELVWKGPLA